MPDIRIQDAALACASTVWRGTVPLVLPLTIALAAIHGARLCTCGEAYPALSWSERERLARQ